MPNPNVLKALRSKHGLSQAEAAAVVGKAWRTWQDWELSMRVMPPAMFELFCTKMGEDMTTWLDVDARLDKLAPSPPRAGHRKGQQLNVLLPPKVLDAFREACRRRDLKPSEAATEAIIAWLAKRPR